MLYAGDIHAADLGNPSVNARTGFNSEVIVNLASRNGNIFETHSAFFGYVLAHESEHAAQFRGLRGLLNEARFRFGSQGFRDRIEDAA